VHLDYVLSCRVIAEERRRVLARALHQPLERRAAVERVEAARAKFRAQASALHARLATARLFEHGELADLRARLAELVAVVDGAASALAAAAKPPRALARGTEQLR
jgi:hypothetical protein